MNSENELDKLLQEWATRNELSEMRATAIRESILPIVIELPGEWWKELFQRIAEPVRQSTDFRPLLASRAPL